MNIIPACKRQFESLAALIPIGLLATLLLSACGGGGGGGGGGGEEDNGSGGSGSGTSESGATIFTGGTLDELRAMNSDLSFDDLVITGHLSLPTWTTTAIKANNLSVTADGSIGYNYSTCTYAAAPAISIQATGEVNISGDITLNGRSGTSVTSTASCNSCYGQDGGDISISASKIVLNSDIKNHGGSGGTYRDRYGSSSCSGGDSGNTILTADIVDLSGTSMETRSGRGGYSCYYSSCGYGRSGTSGDVTISASSMFRMNPGEITSDGTFTLQATQVDIVGPIYYDALDASIVDNMPPTVSIVSPSQADTVDLNQPLTVRIEASDSGLGLRSFDISGFGASETYYSAAEMQNGILEFTIPEPAVDTTIQVVARDNAGNESSTSVTGLSVRYDAEQEPNDSVSTAQILSLPVAIEGVISPDHTGNCYPGIASTYTDSSCYYHTAQDFFDFSVDEDGDYIIHLEFENNTTETDIDMYLDYGDNNYSTKSLWWTASYDDNPGTGNYTETIKAYLFKGTTFHLALQAWPSWSGTASYRLTIRKAP